MAGRTDRYPDEKGPSAKHLVLMFLAAVAVCAVFFSLGFVVGYNHSSSKVVPVTEDVGGSSAVPPTVNTPAGGAGESSSQGMETENVNSGSASSTAPLHPAPVQSEPAAKPPSHVRSEANSATGKEKRAKTPARTRRESAPSKVRQASRKQFAVQVMASSTRADAETLVKLLKRHGYRVYILSPQQAHAKDKLFRVRVGPFSTRVDADRARDKLESEGFRPFVVHGNL